MIRSSCLFVLGLVILTPLSAADAGIIVYNNDEWTLSNFGYSQQPVNAPQFALNVASYLSNGGPGNFLVYSSNFGLAQSQLASTMTGAGHSWTVNTAIPFTLANLMGFDAVFLASFGSPPPSAAVLTSYVNAGGNVYIAGGTGFGDSVDWNPFLAGFGLQMVTNYNGVGGNIPISSPHPIFSGVTALFQNNGNTVIDLAPLDPQNQILITSTPAGLGLYAIYEPSVSPVVPEPATLSLFGLGALGLAGARFGRRPRVLKTK